MEIKETAKQNSLILPPLSTLFYIILNLVIRHTLPVCFLSIYTFLVEFLQGDAPGTMDGFYHPDVFLNDRHGLLLIIIITKFPSAKFSFVQRFSVNGMLWQNFQWQCFQYTPLKIFFCIVSIIASQWR